MEIIPVRMCSNVASRTDMEAGRARWRLMPVLKRLRKQMKYADFDRASRRHAIEMMERSSVASDDLASPHAEDPTPG